jgi:hypothetical protein
VEAARAISNQTPWRYEDAYVTPEVLWGCRVPIISQQEREAFARAVQVCRLEARSSALGAARSSYARREAEYGLAMLGAVLAFSVGHIVRP